ncbi:MAG: histidinol-phosphatase [Candidatus Aenigmatarchaeota archaeon]|nr:MAG: histidinol-phosphatase [Candidatus Aenigmarchaeota archaeon]
MKIWEKYSGYLLSGEWHIHTNYTDGKNSVSEICETAEKLKIPLIAFTEHVRKKLNYDFNQFLEDIKKAKKEFPNIIMLSGCEAKVLPDGSLDVNKNIMEKVDYGIFAFHSFTENAELYKKSFKEVIKNEYVSAWAHPETFFNRVALTENELIEIFNLLKKNNILFEINRKYKISENYLQYARKFNVPVVKGNDIHSISDIINYGK